MAKKLNKKRILILSANPIDTKRLRLDEEVREINDELACSQNRSNFIIEHKQAVRIRDFRRAFLEFNPNIVHFCGHGARTNGLMAIEDETGRPIG